MESPVSSRSASPSGSIRAYQVVREFYVAMPGIRRPVRIDFRLLTDGTWASDALLAVRRGAAGRTVYAEALHLSERQPQSSLSAPIHPAATNLRRFRGLAPTVLGVAAGRLDGWSVAPDFRISITAERRLCDENWVSTPPGTPLYASAAPALIDGGQSLADLERQALDAVRHSGLNIIDARTTIETEVETWLDERSDDGDFRGEFPPDTDVQKLRAFALADIIARYEAPFAR
jgi:hypothetical protein